jgi:hypothetical protein
MPPAIPSSRTGRRTLRELSSREWRDLIAAQVALLQAQLRVWLQPQGKLAYVTAPRPLAEEATDGPDASLDRARTLALAVRRAGAYGVFRPACLTRAIAICRLMETRGIPGGEVRVGVQLKGEKFAAHAWVEYHGAVLGDDAASVSGYEPLAGVGVVHLR